MGEVTPLRLREAAPISSLVTVDPHEVEVVDRLRPIDPDWVAFMAQEIDRDGLRVAPWVRFLPGGRIRLVVGAHRLAAVKSLGWTALQVHPFNGDADDARSWEIAENLVRRELGALDRAAFTAELYDLARRKAGWAEGQSAHAVASLRRWAKDASANLTQASALDEAVAAKVGLSVRTVQRQLELFRGLDPRVRAALAGHPVAENASQLRLLARQSNQAQIVEWLCGGEIASVAEGVARTSPKAPSDPSKKHLSAFLGAFARMGVREQRQALAALKLPAGMRLVIDGDAG